MSSNITLLNSDKNNWNILNGNEKIVRAVKYCAITVSIIAFATAIIIALGILLLGILALGMKGISGMW